MKEYIVITGASSGIGHALAVNFASSGINVIAIGRNELALQNIKSLSGNTNVTTVVANLAKDSELDKVANTLPNMDKIIYIIHCAATSEPHTSLTKISREALLDTINTNVMAPIFLTQKLTPYFYENLTRVLYIGSDYEGVNDKINPEITGAYGISKSALRSAVEHLRNDKTKMLVGYLNPGATNTPMFDKFKSAIATSGNLFNYKGQLSTPTAIAEFIRSVLEKTTNEEFIKVNWDFRKDAGRTFTQTDEKTSVCDKIKNKT